MSFVVDCGMLATAQKMQRDAWRDPQANIDKIPNAQIIGALLQNQDVSFPELTSPTMDRKVVVEWPTKCEIDTTACSDDCTITGEDVTPECKEYEIECLRETSFKLAERYYRDKNMSFEEAFAANILLHKKALVDWLDQYTLAQLALNAGTNQFTGGIGTVAPGITTIAPSYWDDNVWGYFAQVVAHNQLNSPYLVTGDNLFQKIWNKGLEDQTRPFDWLRPVTDPRAFATAGMSNETLLIHKTAAAFLNKAWNPVGAANAIERVGGQYREWSEPLTFAPAETRGIAGLNNVYVDITLQETCEDNDWYFAVKMKLWGSFATNPLPCNELNTGILLFDCA